MRAIVKYIALHHKSILKATYILLYLTSYREYSNISIVRTKIGITCEKKSFLYDPDIYNKI